MVPRLDVSTQHSHVVRFMVLVSRRGKALTPRLLKFPLSIDMPCIPRMAFWQTEGCRRKSLLKVHHRKYRHNNIGRESALRSVLEERAKRSVNMMIRPATRLGIADCESMNALSEERLKTAASASGQPFHLPLIQPLSTP